MHTLAYLVFFDRIDLYDLYNLLYCILLDWMFRVCAVLGREGKGRMVRMRVCARAVLCGYERMDECMRVFVLRRLGKRLSFVFISFHLGLYSDVLSTRIERLMDSILGKR